MDAIETILRLARDYADAKDLSLRQTSWRVFGDTNKVDQLISGGDLTTRRFSQAVAWFASNWPDGLDWPSCVARPGLHSSVPSSDDEEDAPAAPSCQVDSSSSIQPASVNP